MAYRYDEQNGFYDEHQPPRPTPPPSPKKQEGAGDVGAWIFILVMFGIAWPVGLFLLIAKLSEGGGKKKAAKGGQVKANKTVKKVTQTPTYSAKGAKRMKTIGIILSVIGCVALLGTLTNDLSYAYHYNEWMYFLRQLFYPLGFTAGGLSLLLGSGAMKRRNRRYATYLRTAGQKQAVPLAHLARSADVSERRLEKDLDVMLERGMWGEEAYIDRGNDMLFRSQQAATAYFAAVEAAKAPKAEEPQSPPPEGYDAILHQIRDLNDRIADEALSAKIDRLEQVSGRIFKVIENDAEKRAAAGKFLNYYLPTTLKLLENYAAFEEAGVSGENLSQAKAKIEKTMDSIVEGFEHQLDELYRADALDIDSDIRVMETMLRRDTASVADDFGLGGTAVQAKEE